MNTQQYTREQTTPFGFHVVGAKAPTHVEAEYHVHSLRGDRFLRRFIVRARLGAEDIFGLDASKESGLLGLSYETRFCIEQAAKAERRPMAKGGYGQHWSMEFVTFIGAELK
jgi:hypothetical protein